MSSRFVVNFKAGYQNVPLRGRIETPTCAAIQSASGRVPFPSSWSSCSARGARSAAGFAALKRRRRLERRCRRRAAASDVAHNFFASNARRFEVLLARSRSLPPRPSALRLVCRFLGVSVFEKVTALVFVDVDADDAVSSRHLRRVCFRLSSDVTLSLLCAFSLT